MSRLTLSQELKELLIVDAESFTIAELVERVGDRGFGLLLVVLSLPSALPVPAAGYSIPFGVLLLVLSLQMLAGRHYPAFPRKLGARRIQRASAERFLSAAAWIFKRMEWFIRPRMAWIGNRAGRSLMGILVLLMAVLMLIPIPLTNSFPALVIFLIGVGLTEEDGLFAIAACVVGVFAILLYAALIAALIVYGPEVVTTIKDFLRSFW